MTALSDDAAPTDGTIPRWRRRQRLPFPATLAAPLILGRRRPTRRELVHGLRIAMQQSERRHRFDAADTWTDPEFASSEPVLLAVGGLGLPVSAPTIHAVTNTAMVAPLSVELSGACTAAAASAMPTSGAPPGDEPPDAGTPQAPTNRARPAAPRAPSAITRSARA